MKFFNLNTGTLNRSGETNSLSDESSPEFTNETRLSEISSDKWTVRPKDKNFEKVC